MPAALNFDTLKFAKRLTDAGMDSRQEAIVLGLTDADASELVTKSDLNAAMAELKAELFRFLYLQAIGIVGLTVALIKLLPG